MASELVSVDQCSVVIMPWSYSFCLLFFPFRTGEIYKQSALLEGVRERLLEQAARLEHPRRNNGLHVVHESTTRQEDLSGLPSLEVCRRQRVLVWQQQPQQEHRSPFFQTGVWFLSAFR